MNLLNQFDQLFDRQEQAIAKVVGQRGSGRVVAETQGGSTVILIGEMETGKQCFYDRRTSKILGIAPDITFSNYAV